jgi:hypothetical protein
VLLARLQRHARRFAPVRVDAHADDAAMRHELFAGSRNAAWGAVAQRYAEALAVARASAPRAPGGSSSVSASRSIATIT